MSDYVILDTDVFSAITAGRATAARYEAVLRNKTQALTFVSVAELLYGARHGGWGERRTTALVEKIERLLLIPFDKELPAVWAQLRDLARRRGHPLAQPAHTNDLWIAACAVLYQAPLLTGNRRHFLGVPELTVVRAEDLEAGVPY
ncbi:MULTISPECIES: PIN domain-containing protein [unclassified Frankia]|uniref:PIN domain-containing protein n=1 Tax=unclassified Frankia TaxID=2632575 RepID=UPI00202521EC